MLLQYPRRHSNEQGESGIADQSQAGHHASDRTVDEAIALNERDLWVEFQNADEIGDVTRVHLTVGVNLDDKMGADGERLPEARFHGASHAEVPRMGDDVNSRIPLESRTHDVARAFGACIVDHDDGIAGGKRVRNDSGDGRSGLEGGDDADRHTHGHRPGGAGELSAQITR